MTWARVLAVYHLVVTCKTFFLLPVSPTCQIKIVRKYVEIWIKNYSAVIATKGFPADNALAILVATRSQNEIFFSIKQ